MASRISEKEPSATRAGVERGPLSWKTQAEILRRLSLAVFVFKDGRPAYANHAGEQLRARLRQAYRIEVDILLADQLRALLEPGPRPPSQPLLAQVTAPDREPFYLHAIPLEGRRLVAVSVRTVGSQVDAVRASYGLTSRESQVAELVLHGYRNADIAQALHVAPATVKKHLGRIFDKVGVDSRTQLSTRLG